VERAEIDPEVALLSRLRGLLRRADPADRRDGGKDLVPAVIRPSSPPGGGVHLHAPLPYVYNRPLYLYNLPPAAAARRSTHTTRRRSERASR
jgi:hypothetical protein